MIQLKDALNIMKARDDRGKPIPFDLTVVTCNLREGTGGQRVTYKGATLLAGGNSKKQSAKDPNNWRNHTRNLEVPGKSRPVKIHTLLITAFNGEKVFI